MRGCWGRVLIETLWNVNINWTKILYLDNSSFNRNIVECKWVLEAPESRIKRSFNRNIVECK